MWCGKDVDAEVSRRQRDCQLDKEQYEGVHQMPEHDREEWGLQVRAFGLTFFILKLIAFVVQPHDVQEMQARVLLGMHGCV